MEDPKPVKRSQKWEEKLLQMARSTFLEAVILLTLGYIVYVGGSVLILKFVPDEQKAFIYQMILFQCLVMFMAVYKIYPKISMSTSTLIESSRDTMPVFENLEETMKKATLDFKEEGRKIRSELTELKRALTKPIESPMRKIVPARKVGNGKTTHPSNGS